MGPQAQTQHTRVSGNVVPGTIVRSAEIQDVRFQVEDESGKLTVVFSGVLSDIFGGQRAGCRRRQAGPGWRLLR